MVRTTEAIFSDGVLKPVEPLGLREQQRVRITVEEVEAEPPTEAERAAALKQFFENADRMGFRSKGPYPTRDELHERR
jgi:predicted DNA-binding antitoxin AbrB/MazE fold protein